MRYPETRKGDVVDRYGTTRIADPYRWLEDLDSPEVAAWVAAQNAVTFAHLDTLPLRDHLKQRLTELWDYPRTSLPVVENGRLFYAKNTGLQRQSPIYVAHRRLRSAGAGASIPTCSPPTDRSRWRNTRRRRMRRLIAYAIAEGGADWETLRVRNVATGEDLGRHRRLGALLRPVVDARLEGLLLLAVSGAAGRQGARGGAVGPGDLLPPRRHAAIGRRPDLSAAGSPVVDRQRDGQRRRALRVHPHVPRRRQQQPAALHQSRQRRAAERSPRRSSRSSKRSTPNSRRSATTSTRVYLRSDKDAPNRRIIAIDLENTDPGAWKVVVPEQRARDRECRAHRRPHRDPFPRRRAEPAFSCSASTARSKATSPCPASARSRRCTDDRISYDVWFTFSSPLSPATVYRYDLDSRSRMAFEPPLPPIDPSQFETRAMFATSKDGTRVPFFLTSKKGLPLDGRNPTMLYGYGGFSISVLPFYRSDVPAWLELGGVFVTVNMRGGAEYGEAWHKAGYLDKKQNVFDDFIAVAEHLVKERYTSPDRLGIMGGSNGGLLVGAVMEQRPESVRRGAARRRRDGHAPLRQIHRRQAVGDGVRIVIRSAAVRVPDQVLAAAQRARRRHATRRRSSRPPITTIASCPATPSSSSRRCRPRRPAIARRLFAWKLEARTRIGRPIG